MALTIKLRQGNKNVLPDSGIVQGEPLYASDTHELYVATGTTTRAPAVIDLVALDGLGGGGGAAIASDDLLYMYDVSESAASPRARSVTKADFKTALAIPEASTDEKVAVAEAATPGYLGTGADGVLRWGNALGVTAGSDNAYVTADISIEDEAQGDIIYRSSTGWTRLGAGTQGYLLKTNGASANPEWLGVIDGGSFA